tara:strand:+ start:73946 stop:74401 length:456 start_codon:yes stop_codon:yes gene_type:complete
MTTSTNHYQISQHILTCKEEFTSIPLPLFLSKIRAGFPSPADDHLDKTLDLNDLMIKNPPSTFFVKVEGDSMTGIGMFPGDLLVIDRSREPSDGKIIIAALDGELTVKRIKKLPNNLIRLDAENKNYSSITVSADQDFTVWGVVTGVIRSL